MTILLQMERVFSMSAIHNLFASYSLTSLLLVHIVIASVLSYAISLYISKRYPSRGDAVEEHDRIAMEEVEVQSSLFKLIFKISLYRNNALSSRLFFFLFNLSFPFIGYLFSIWLAYYLVHIKYAHKVVHTNMLNLDEFATSFLKIERIFGEGSMSTLILNDDVPKSKKLKALSSLSSNVSPNTLRIIKQTLSSKDDEIRMYGYSNINKIEKQLNSNINLFLETYRTQEGEKKYDAAKNLAFSYWEMVYIEISHESLRDSFLEEVIKYVNIAKKYYIQKRDEYQKELEQKEELLEKMSLQDILEKGESQKIALVREECETIKESVRHYRDITAKLFMLMGRVHMVQQKYEDAMSEFTVAHDMSDGDASFVLPYLAEIYFILGKYNIVHAIMKKSDSLLYNPKLYPIVQQWRAS